MRTRVEGEDVPDERFRLSLTSDHGGDLDDGVDLRFGKDTFTARTFDIEAEYTERRYVQPIAFRRMRYEVFVAVKTLATDRDMTGVTHCAVISIWHNDFLAFPSRSSYLPPLNSTQFIPTTYTVSYAFL